MVAGLLAPIAAAAFTGAAAYTHVTTRLTFVTYHVTLPCMIKSFRHKGLSELFAKGRTAKIDARMQKRIAVILGALDRASTAEAMNVPGLEFHALRGFDPIRYTVHVSGPWCLTFEFSDGDAYRVDYEQYH